MRPDGTGRDGTGRDRTRQDETGYERTGFEKKQRGKTRDSSNDRAVLDLSEASLGPGNCEKCGSH